MSNGGGTVIFTFTQNTNSTEDRIITCTNCSVSGASVTSGSGFSVSHSGNTITVTRTSTSAFSGEITVTGTASDGNHNDPSSITITVSGSTFNPGVSLIVSSVGNIVSSNGMAYPATYKDSWNSAWGTPAGVVTYKNGYNGYVVALYNCGGSADSDGNTYTWDSRATDLSTITSVSGKTWVVGTKDEYTTALTSDWDNNMTRITNAGGRALGTHTYWSSTESYLGTSWHFSIFDSNIWLTAGKSAPLHIRPLFEF